MNPTYLNYFHPYEDLFLEMDPRGLHRKVCTEGQPISLGLLEEYLKRNMFQVSPEFYQHLTTMGEHVNAYAHLLLDYNVPVNDTTIKNILVAGCGLSVLRRIVEQHGQLMCSQHYAYIPWSLNPSEVLAYFVRESIPITYTDFCKLAVSFEIACNKDSIFTDQYLELLKRYPSYCTTEILNILCTQTIPKRLFDGMLQLGAIPDDITCILVRSYSESERLSSIHYIVKCHAPTTMNLNALIALRAPETLISGLMRRGAHKDLLTEVMIHRFRVQLTR